MAGLIKRTVKGKEYYYLEKPVRFGRKVIKLSLYLGKEKPSKKGLKIKEKELEEKALERFYKKRLDKYKSFIFTGKEVAESVFYSFHLFGPLFCSNKKIFFF